MLNAVKLSLRITTTAFDVEVQDLIDAARMDLQQSGVSASIVTKDTDPLIKRAITLYCKAFFGYDNPDADRLRDSYVMLKQHLSLAADYNGVNDAV
jgi:uncharacterized phage protein (predicted DNA packaging)